MPDRLTLVKGPPAARRSHLDGFVAALRPARAEARRRYARALAQRNALVSRIRARAASVDSLDAWDAELAEAGVELMDARAGAVDVLAPLFATTAGELGLDGARAPLRAAVQGRELPGSFAPSWRSAGSRISRAASRATARTWTRLRSTSAARRRGATRRRASSARPSSRSSSPSATRSLPSAPSRR